MEKDELKELWRNLPAAGDGGQDMSSMLRSRDCVFKQVRMQLRIESLALFVFLVVYYSAFDGADKPTLLNIILVMATLTCILLGIYGELMLKKHIATEPLLKGLKLQISRLQHYAFLSIISKAVFGLALLSFFNIGLELDSRQVLANVLILASMLIQGFVLWSVWKKRIKSIQEHFDMLNSF